MKRLFFFIVLLFALAASALANSGKIAGRVMDEKGEGIAGANVVLVETQRGVNIQNLDGSYVILGVQPGIYTARITSLSYSTQTFSAVLVAENEITTLNATLPEAVLQGEEQVIVWEKPAILPDGAQLNSRVTARELRVRLRGDISDGNWGRKHPSVRRVNTIGVPAHILVQYKIPVRVRYR
jgi:hypothetical protein